MRVKFWVTAIISLILFTLTGVTLAYAADPGDLDTSFGTGGIVLTDMGGNNSEINDTVLQPDGKILAVGRSFGQNGYDVTLVRYNSNGSLDTTFGSGGIVITSVSSGSDDWGNAITLQSDGRIVVAGLNAGSGTGDFTVIRYNSNGSLDSTFGSGGIVTTSISNNYDDEAKGLVIQPDNKIVVAGFADNGIDYDFVVVRYNSNGSLDTSFDGDGYVVSDLGGSDSSYAVALQPDGKIVAAGYGADGTQSGFILARYNSNGSLDTSFDADGIAVSFIGMDGGSIADIALQNDGKIVAAGISYNGGFQPDITLARYNTNGSLDTTFDTDGIVTTSVSSNSDNYASAIKIQPNGRIVVAGYRYSLGQNEDFVLVRYNINGSLDSSFDADGIVITPIGIGQDQVAAIALQSDGKIVATGQANSTFAVARYQTNGSLDLTFDTDGKVFTNLGNGYDGAAAMALQSDGKIVAAGYRSQGHFFDTALARYNSDGTLDSTFGGEGIVITSISNDDDEARAVAIQTDGKIVVAGSTFFTSTRVAVTRYNTNGTLDSTFDGDGIVITSIDSILNYVSAVGIQADGKIVVAGSISNIEYSDADFLLVRYNSNGSLDTSFDADGIVTTPIGSNTYDYANDLALLSNGKIVVVGSTDGTDFVVVRYNSNGSLDTSFDTDGIVATSFNGSSTAYAVVVQASGKIVVVGSSYDAGSGYSDFALARYNSNGTLDTSFNGDGKLITSITNIDDRAYAVASQANDKIVVAGASNYEIDVQPPDFTVVRFNSNGSFDTSFDTDGVVTTPLGSGWDEANAVALQSNGKIVAAGVGGLDDFAVVRYQGDASSPVLSLTKTVNTSLVTPGQRITYTISVQNSGAENATGALISDTLPAGLTQAGPVSLSPAGVGVVGTAPTLVSNLTITAGQRVTVTLPVTVNASLVGSTRITNTAAVTSAGVITRVTGSAMFTTANVPAITITKIANVGAAQVGQIVTYTYRVTNTGNITLTGITVKDNKLGNVLLGNLILGPNVGTNGLLTYTVSLTDLPGPLTNTVTVTGTSPTGSNLTAQAVATVTLLAGPDIQPPVFPVPALITPTLGVALKTTRPTFDWAEASDNVGVISYTLVLSSSNSALALQATATVTTTQSIFTPTIDLPADSYTWTVRAYDAAGNVAVAPLTTFAIQAEQAPEIKAYLPVILK